MATVTSLDDLKITSQQIPAYDGIPNTSILEKPLLVYHSAFAPNTSASQIESHLKSVGAVVPQWRYTMYSQTHYHSTTHEVLCVFAGRARCCFGGENNPARFEPVLSPGDVVIVPAGVGHRLLEDFGGFQMVGSYPPGKQWDMCYGSPGKQPVEDGHVEVIRKLEWFKSDPIYGDSGPLHHVH